MGATATTTLVTVALTSIPPDVAADIKRQAVALERIATTLEGTAKAAIFDAKHKAGQ